MQHLIVQIDSRGAACLLTEPAKGGAASVVAAALVEPVDDAERFAESIAAALPQVKRSGVELIALLPPAEIKTRWLETPPAPPEELPMIVRMQAAREAGDLEEEDPVDFLVTGASGTLAAWCEAGRVEWWGQAASRLGGRLASVTPRALATLGLAPREAGDHVLVTQAGEAIDIAVVRSGELAQARSARIAADDRQRGADRELRRTLLSTPTSGPAEVWHDGVLPDTSGGRQIDLPGSAGNAAAFGAALLAARGEAPPIDLANPRKPEENKLPNRSRVLMAVTAAVVLLAGAWWAYIRVARLDSKIASLEGEIRAVEEDLDHYQPYVDKAEAIDAWLASDVTWLDELERLSGKLRPEKLDSGEFPVESDVRVIDLMATARVGGDEPGGQIVLQAMVRSPMTDVLESRLRDETHLVEPVSTVETNSLDEYRYAYRATLRMPAERDEPAEPNAPADGEATSGDNRDDSKPTEEAS